MTMTVEKSKGYRIASGKETFIKLNEDNFHSEVIDCDIPVLVKFGAEWLGTCDIMAPILEELGNAFAGKIKMASVDVDDNEQLVKEYGITNLPVFIFFKNGVIVDHVVGAAPKNVFTSKIKACCGLEGES